MTQLFAWVRSHEFLVAGLGILSAIFFVGSLLFTPLLVARIPVDYFAHETAPPSRWAKRHPLARLALRIARNLLGAVLIFLGLALLVLPGQGLLTILMGFLALEFPGKRRLELRLLRRPRIRAALDWMRRRAGREPLLILEARRDA